MKLAIFGGTFDPIHAGHLLMAEAAREQFKLDRVVFLPTGIPPHKNKKIPAASATQRLAMVRKAIRGNSAFDVSAWDISQRRAVYTFEAIQHFKATYKKAALFFILGSDSLHDVPTWRQGSSLLKQCRFLVVERKEASWTAIPRSLRAHASRVTSPLCQIASHALRARVAQRESIRYQVPDAVMSYIQAHRLYAKSRT